MYSLVKRLRVRGERRSDREIAADDGIVGRISMYKVEKLTVISVHAPLDDAQRKPIIPELYSAKVVSMHGDRMLVQGWERVGNPADPNAPMQRQEWSVRLAVPQPAGVAATSHRPGLAT